MWTCHMGVSTSAKYMLCSQLVMFSYPTRNKFVMTYMNAKLFREYSAALGWTLRLSTFFLLWRCDPTRVIVSSFLSFLNHKQRRTTIGRTPLDVWSARRKDLYLTTHNTHNRQTSMPPGGIRTHGLSRRTAADLRLRPRGHWDRLTLFSTTGIFDIHMM